MVDDHGNVGVACGDDGNVGHLCRIELEVERQTVARQLGEALDPFRITQQIAGRVGFQRVFMPADDLAHAAYVRPGGVGLQQGVQVGIQHIGAGDDGVRITTVIGKRLKPVGFGQLLTDGLTGLDMDDLVHAPVGRVRQVVLQQIVCVGDGRHISRRIVRQGIVLKPAIARTRQVPQVDVAVDNAKVRSHALVLSMSFCRPTCRTSRRW